MHVAACIGISIIAAVIIYLIARKFRKKPRRKLVEPGVVLHQFSSFPLAWGVELFPAVFKVRNVSSHGEDPVRKRLSFGIFEAG